MIDNDHKCIIGQYHDNMIDSLITLNGLLYYVNGDMELEFEKIASLDPVYSSIYHSYKHYTMNDYLDKRKSTNLRRFEYCPDCGKKIDWKKMREDYAVQK